MEEYGKEPGSFIRSVLTTGKIVYCVSDVPDVKTRPERSPSFEMASDCP